ncbi:MAG: hypothetical protein AB1630_11655, partial [bacterium]
DSHIDYDLFVYSGDQSSAGPLIAQSTYGRGRPDECTLTRSGYIWIKVFNYSSSGSGNYSLGIEGPRILLDKIGIYYHNDTDPTRHYPYDSDRITIKALVWANDGQGTRTYADAPLNNDGYWYIAGSDGAMGIFANPPSLPANTTIYQWQSPFQTPTFNWTVWYHRTGNPYNQSNRDYWYETLTSTLITGWGTTTSFALGTKRYSTKITLGTQSVSSKVGEYATRISVRQNNTPQGHIDRATQYLRWLTAYLQYPEGNSDLYSSNGIPYEWGGHWFGGRTGNRVGDPNPYEGYGIDCSGLVSCGARFAGYNWSSWRQTTSGLPNVSDAITQAQLQPGDILNRTPTPDRSGHVVTVYRIDPNNRDRIDVIEATGKPPNEPPDRCNKVRIVSKRLRIDYLDQGYTIRRLR